MRPTVGDTSILGSWYIQHAENYRPDVTVVAVPLLIVGPLRHSPPLWNANNISEPLAGQVVRNGTNLTQIVSFVGKGTRPQRLLIRADLLVETQGLKHTSLQLEYLPSGDICRGTVTNITQGGTGFTGTCRMKNGETRSVTANWGLTGAGNGVIGQIQLSG